MQKRSKFSIRWKKINNQPWFIHLKWTYWLSTLSGSTGASHLMNQCFHGPDSQVGQAAGLRPKRQAAGLLLTLGQGQSPCRATTGRAGVFFPSFGKHVQDQVSRTLTHPGAPQSHLSVLAFQNRSGQSRLIMDRFAIFIVHYFDITFGNTKPYKVSE